jgi:hypothetical protein
MRAGVEGWRTRNFASAEGGAEAGQREAQELPVVCVGLEAGLVLDTVETVVGQQAELELPGVTTHLDQAGGGASLSAVRWIRPD